MDSIELYRPSAAQAARGSFIARHRDLFLLKAPTVARPAPTPATQAEPIPFDTKMLSSNELIDIQGAFAWAWCVSVIKKRPGNPFPERISVGRATNCDVVLRLPYVSKSHAHFLVAAGELKLDDLRSGNGTFVNGREVKRGEPQLVVVGDRLRFGSLEVELADAGRIHDVLMYELPAR